MPRRNIRLLLEYDGTPFLGWQVQPQGPTVQSTLQDALRRITGEPAVVKGSGRTDAGVHALGQVANFFTEARMEANAFRRALNSMLPDSVAVLRADEVPEWFDSQFSTVSKRYVYRILNRRDQSPIERSRSWHVRFPLDVEKMGVCASFLLGKNDFSSFRAAGCVASDPVRTVVEARFSTAVDIVSFEIEADGFLRHMVRNILGTLVEAGRGRFSTGDFKDILASRDRARAGIAAPPQGLYLASVAYPESVAPPPRGS